MKNAVYITYNEMTELLNKKFGHSTHLMTMTNDRTPYAIGLTTPEDDEKFVKDYGSGAKNVFYEDGKIFCDGKAIGLCVAEAIGLVAKDAEDGYGKFDLLHITDGGNEVFFLLCKESNVRIPIESMQKNPPKHNRYTLFLSDKLVEDLIREAFPLVNRLEESELDSAEYAVIGTIGERVHPFLKEYSSSRADRLSDIPSGTGDDVLYLTSWTLGRYVSKKLGIDGMGARLLPVKHADGYTLFVEEQDEA